MTQGGPDSTVTGVKGSLWDEWPQALVGRGWGLLRLSLPSGLSPHPQGVRGPSSCPFPVTLPASSSGFRTLPIHTHASLTHPQSHTPRAQPRAHTHTEGCATAAGGRVTARCRRSRPHPGCPSHSALRTRGWAAPLKPRRERGLTRMGLLRALGRAGRPSSPQAPPDLSHQLLPSSTFSRNRA